MARFYANIQGNRGEATRMGTTASGIGGHIRGWNVGGRVELHVNESGEDEVWIWLTSGSNGSHNSKCLGCFTVKDLEKT